MLVEWPATDKAALAARAEAGLVVVSWDGCRLSVLPGCRVEGVYHFTETTPARDRIDVMRKEELFAKLPLSFATLEGLISGGSSLHVDYVAVGARRSSVDDVRRSDLSGGECAAATHFVRSIVVGAHELFTRRASQSSAEVTVLGAGAGGSRGEDARVLRSSGDLYACMRSGDGYGPRSAYAEDVEPAPVRSCGALLQVEIAGLTGDEPPDAGPAPPTPHPSSDPEPPPEAATTERDADLLFDRRDFAGARTAYSAIVAAYRSRPEASRVVVRCSLRSAECARELRDDRGARAALAETATLFVAMGALPGSEAAEYAARAKYLLLEGDLRTFEAMRVGGDRDGLARSAQLMAARARDLETAYRSILLYRRPAWSVAAQFRSGYVWDRYAEVVAAARAPASIAAVAEARETFENGLADGVRPVEDRAVAAYRVAHEMATAAGVRSLEASWAHERLNHYLPGEFPFSRGDRPAFVVFEPLGPAGIRRVIRSRIALVRSCYERGLERHADMAGRVDLQFVIGPDGVVTSAQIRSSELGDPPVEQCIVSNVRNWAFPVPVGGDSTTVNYPFILHQSP